MRRGWRLDKRVGAIRTGLALALVPLTPCALLAVEDDPAPTEEELLRIPDSPAAPEGEPEPGDDLIPSLPESVRINHDGELFIDAGAGTLRYTNAQVRTDNNIQMFAREVFVDTKRELVRLTGDVAIYQGTVLHRGEQAVYYYGEERLETTDLRTSIDPVILEAGQFRSVRENGRQYYIGEDAGLTTHDDENPSYWVRADKTIVIPNDRIIFENMRIFAGGRQIFWLPKLSQSLNAELGYKPAPGAQSAWGLFLLNRYGMMLGGDPDPVTGINDTAWLLAQWHFDLYQKRGLGLGVDLYDTRLSNNPNLGWLKLYYLNDLDPTIVRSGLARGNINEDRFRAQLRHRIELDWFAEGHTHADADLTILSDSAFLQDFDPGTFRIEPAPDNVLALTHQRDHNLFTLWTRLRPNDFYQSDTRYPELAFDQVRRPIFGSGVLHEGQTTLGLYDEHLPSLARTALADEASMLMAGDPRLAEINSLLADRGYVRFHTWQELSCPTAPTDWLTIVPHAGLGFTSYGAVEGPGTSTTRTHFSTSVDAAVKFSRDYPDIVSERWGIDGLRHIVQPYVTASWLMTDELDPSFGRIDRLTASTRPRPINVGRFTAIDDLTDWTILRLGTRHRLLTRRDGGTHEWLTLNTYLDYFIEDPEFSRKFSNLYNELTWSPVPWLDLTLETQFPVFRDTADFTEIATGVRYMPTDSLELILRQRFLSNHPILVNSNRVELEAHQRFNQNWSAGLIHRWELEDGTLEYQQYSLHRSLDSWALSAGFFQRDNRVKNELGFVLGFTLNDFPDVSLPLRINSE